MVILAILFTCQINSLSENYASDSLVTAFSQLVGGTDAAIRTRGNQYYPNRVFLFFKKRAYFDCHCVCVCVCVYVRMCERVRVCACASSAFRKIIQFGVRNLAQFSSFHERVSSFSWRSWSSSRLDLRHGSPLFLLFFLLLLLPPPFSPLPSSPVPSCRSILSLHNFIVFVKYPDFSLHVCLLFCNPGNHSSRRSYTKRKIPRSIMLLAWLWDHMYFNPPPLLLLSHSWFRFRVSLPQNEIPSNLFELLLQSVDDNGKHLSVQEIVDQSMAFLLAGSSVFFFFFQIRYVFLSIHHLCLIFFKEIKTWLFQVLILNYPGHETTSTLMSWFIYALVRTLLLSFLQ